MGAFLGVIIYQILTRQHYNLNQTSLNLVGRLFDNDQFVLTNETQACFHPPCDQITVRELANIFAEQTIYITTKDKTANCSRYTIELLIENTTT
jgi:hypothetical protein